MLLHWSKNLKSIPTWKTGDEDEGAEDCNTSGALTPMGPLPPSIGRTGGDTATSRLLATWTNLIPTIQVRPLSQICITRPWHRSLLHCEMELSPLPGLATHFRGKRLRQTHGRLLLSLCQRPVNMVILANLTRRNHILEAVKRKLWSPDLMTLPGNRIINTCAKMSAEFPTHFKTALSKMLWTLRSNSTTSDTGIMPPSELGREERVSTMATLR